MVSSTIPLHRPTTQFIVAEDTGGINTGVFMVRAEQWGVDYFKKVAKAPYTAAWDQSQFFWEAVHPSLFHIPSPGQDFVLPPEILFVHQAQLNAFVPPASRDWMAYEWTEGDFIRHFAGCPWQEQPCLDMMHETLQVAEQSYRAALEKRIRKLEERQGKVEL